MKYQFSFLFFFIIINSFSQPVITSFSPSSGPIGTLVTITGNNFSTSPSSNTVYFGAVKATVISASTNTLTVTVPIGSTFKPITVTKSGQTAISSKPYIVTFGSINFINQYLFDSAKAFTTGNGPKDIAIGDLDGDGLADIATANNSANTITIFKNTSTRRNVTFGTPIEYTLLSNPQSILMHDIDGDGNLDLLTTSSYKFSVYRNTTVNGNIAFEKNDYYIPGGLNPIDLICGDMDGDGKPDIAVMNYSDFSISIFRNEGFIGAISFSANGKLSTGNLYPFSLAIGDLDGDNKPDIAVSDYTSIYDSISIFRNTSTVGNVSFAPKIDFSKARGALGIAIGDLDGDGKNDIAAACYVSGRVSIFKNTSVIGSLSFKKKLDFTTGTYPESITITDLNGDNKPDLCTGNYSGHSISVLRNSCFSDSISFAPKVDYKAGTNPRSMVAGDIDGDGKPDIVTTNINSNNFTVFRNKIPLVKSLCPNGSATISSIFTSPNYQWQQSIDSVNFINIYDNSNFLGSNTGSLSLMNIPSTWYGYQFRCLLNGQPDEQVTLQFSNTWNQSINTAWENPSNWSCGAVPDSNTDIVINSGTIVLSGSTTIRSLTLGPTANFTVAPDIILTITH